MAFSIFTQAERTVKKHTVGFAVKQAQHVLKEKRYSELCVNAVRGRAYDQLLTTEEVSKLVEELVDDTLFYDGVYHGHSIVHGY